MSSRFASFVSSVLIFGFISSVGLHALAAETGEVQPVRRQFSTAEEISSISVKEKGSSVTIRQGEGDQIQVNYADTSAEKLYNIYTDNGTLTIEKRKEPPKEVITVEGITVESPNPAYDLEIVVPQKQYRSISVSDSINCDVTLDSIQSQELSVAIKNGDASFSETESDKLRVKAFNGSVYLNHTSSAKYDCQAVYGDILGSVAGALDSYSVKAYTDNGSCNVYSPPLPDSGRSGSPSRPDGEHLMALYAQTGNIDVAFDS